MRLLQYLILFILFQLLFRSELFAQLPNGLLRLDSSETGRFVADANSSIYIFSGTKKSLSNPKVKTFLSKFNRLGKAVWTKSMSDISGYVLPVIAFDSLSGKLFICVNLPKNRNLRDFRDTSRTNFFRVFCLDTSSGNINWTLNIKAQKDISCWGFTADKGGVLIAAITGPYLFPARGVDKDRIYLRINAQRSVSFVRKFEFPIEFSRMDTSFARIVPFSQPDGTRGIFCQRGYSKDVSDQIPRYDLVILKNNGDAEQFEQGPGFLSAIDYSFNKVAAQNRMIQLHTLSSHKLLIVTFDKNRKCKKNGIITFSDPIPNALRGGDLRPKSIDIADNGDFIMQFSHTFYVRDTLFGYVPKIGFEAVLVLDSNLKIKAARRYDKGMCSKNVDESNMIMALPDNRMAFTLSTKIKPYLFFNIPGGGFEIYSQNEASLVIAKRNAPVCRISDTLLVELKDTILNCEFVAWSGEQLSKPYSLRINPVSFFIPDHLEPLKLRNLCEPSYSSFYPVHIDTLCINKLTIQLPSDDTLSYFYNGNKIEDSLVMTSSGSYKIVNEKKCDITDYTFDTCQVYLFQPGKLLDTAFFCYDPLTIGPVSKNGYTYRWESSDLVSNPVTTPTQTANLFPGEPNILKLRTKFGKCISIDSTRLLPFKKDIEIVEKGKNRFELIVDPETQKVDWKVTGAQIDFASTSSPWEIEISPDSDEISIQAFTEIEDGCRIMAAWKFESENIANLVLKEGNFLNQQWILSSKYKNCKLEVFSRWGKLVYSTSSYQNDWPKKDEFKSGVYFFKITQNGQIKVGWVTLID